MYKRACLLAMTGQLEAARQTHETLAARHPLSFDTEEAGEDEAAEDAW